MDGYVLHLLATAVDEDLGVASEVEEEGVLLSGELLGGSSERQRQTDK